MKRIIYPGFGILLFCLFTVNAQAQKLVEDVNISSEKATLQMVDQTLQSYLLEIAGPDNYYWKNEINNAKAISLSNLNAEGEKFDDGLYKLQVTPILKLTAGQRTALQEIRHDEKAITAYRLENNLPAQVNIYNINFSIRDGKFVTPNQKEARLSIPATTSSWAQNHPSLYASLNPIDLDYDKPVLISDGPSLPTDNSKISEDDQVFADDVIINGGSLCVGFDCVNGENFGFDTNRLKENNLRIHFDDTSNSASFPSNDWRIVINDSTNGGASHFSIEDATAGRTPFRIEAAAPSNSLYVDADGDVGIKTANPVVDLHIVDGNSPATRFEQDGSDGFTPQTWDISGNETNFFVRDVTNGSKLPFRIRPSAPNNSLYIDTDGDIGMGTPDSGPLNSLHVRRTNGTAKVFVEEASGSASNRVLMQLTNNGGTRLEFTNTSTASEYTTGIANNGKYVVSRKGVSGTAFSIDENNNVGIKTSSPGFELEVNGEAGKPGGGIWATASDRKLKTNIESYTDGLDQLLQIRPVRYEFNGKQGLITGKKFVGIIAQEMQKVAPYMIKETTYTDEAGAKSNYLSYDGSALTYMLINAVKTQNEKLEKQAAEIKDLQEQLSKVAQLQKEVAALAELVKQNAKN